MSLFEAFDISGTEPVELHRERYETEKQLKKLQDRVRADKSASPFLEIQIHEIGKNGRVYMLEDA